MRRARPLHVPPPYEDESVSSWLARIAALHWVSLRELVAQMDLRSPDPDLALAPRDIARLQKLTRQPADVIRSMPLRHDFPQATRLDLVERGDETGLRAQLCPRCLDDDISLGRDHYVRREWLLIWTAACAKHGDPLQELGSIDVVPSPDPRHRNHAVRLARPVDQVIDPYRVHAQRKNGTARRPFQARLLSADILRALRGQGRLADWDCAGNWKAARHALVALSDLLVQRACSDGPPLYAMLLGPVTVKLWLNSPGRHILGRLTPAGRRIVLEALSCLLVDPRRFCVADLHSHAAIGFYGTFRKPDPSQHGPLAHVAILDPLAVVLALAPPRAAQELILSSYAWPDRLRARLGYASAVALAAM